MPRLALIADDLTGAADSGVQFAKRGWSALLLIRPGSRWDADVAIVDTESRSDPPDLAYEKAYRAACMLSSTEFVYKKVDSTLRGNMGAEMEAIMDALGIERAIVAPAFPAMGRTTAGGRQFLEGLPLEKTAFAKDPLCPVMNSYIPDVLANQMHREIGLIGLDTVRHGPNALAEAMATCRQAVLVIDATLEEDLHAVIRAAMIAGVAGLTCGSAGLADALAHTVLPHRDLLCTRDGGSPGAIENAAPVLTVAGSRNPRTKLQLARAVEAMGLTVVAVDTEKLASDQMGEVHSCLLQAGDRLAQGHHVALSVVDSPFVEGLSRSVAQALGQIVVHLVEQYTLAGLVLTGGDVAMEVCQALGVTALSLVDEISPGMPLARTHGDQRKALSLITKAGGFGSPDAIAGAIRHLVGSRGGGPQPDMYVR